MQEESKLHKEVNWYATLGIDRTTYEELSNKQQEEKKQKHPDREE
jgi:hypothetical protein